MKSDEFKKLVEDAEKQIWIDYENGKIESINTEYLFKAGAAFAEKHCHEMEKVKALIEAAKHPWLNEELECSCGYYGDDNEESGMSQCPKCAIAEALAAFETNNLETQTPKGKDKN